MKCERCGTRDAESGHPLCFPCLSTFDWDTKGELTGTDLANLGFAPQPGWEQVLEDVKKARREGTLLTKEEALDFVVKHPALRIRPSDVRFQTLYVPIDWDLLDAAAPMAQPAFEDQMRWWKAEREAGRMVPYGILIDIKPPMVLVGWTCATLQEAERLASDAPWVRSKVLAVLKTVPTERRSRA